MIIRPYHGIYPQIGERVFLAETAVLIGNVEIGEDASIWYGTVLRGDVHSITVGPRTNIQDNCTVHVFQGTFPVRIAEEVTIGHGVVVHGCTIGARALIGMGSTILDGAVIGEEALVAAGSVVAPGTVIPPRSLAIGSPARVKRALNEDELLQLRQSSRSYMAYKDDYLAESGETNR